MGSSYKKIKSVLHNFAHSLFSPMNDPVDKLIFEAMKENKLSILTMRFDKREIVPAGEYPKDIWGAIDGYMEWLPGLAETQGVNCKQINNIEVVVVREKAGHKILVSAIDDRGNSA